MSWAELTDVRCYYELLGSGEPLLLVPGLGGTCRADDPDTALLAEHFTLICPELRGICRSEAKRTPHSLRDNAADLVELLDHLQVERAHIMGLSLGGIIAQRFAVDHPDRVNRLVLLSCAHRFGPFLKEMATLVGHTLRHFPPRLFHRTLELLGTSPVYMDQDPAQIERKLERKAENAPALKQVAQQLRCLVASEPDEEGFRITAPTLVLAGEFDALIPHCYVRRLAEAIPGSHFQLIEGAGHNPLAECPERLMPTLTTFLKTGRVPPIPPLNDSQPVPRSPARTRPMPKTPEAA